uniref:Uncharacterized protein n=1 Tax=Pavo cristatus TaxID=9049 RepID=A0A8C9EU09_PAVCR
MSPPLASPKYLSTILYVLRAFITTMCMMCQLIIWRPLRRRNSACFLFHSLVQNQVQSCTIVQLCWKSNIYKQDSQKRRKENSPPYWSVAIC